MDNLIDVVDEANCHTSDTDSGCDVYTEDPIRKVLRGIEHFPEEIIEKIRATNIEHKNLTALSHEDLELFGIKDRAKQKEILDVFADCMNQASHFDKWLAETNKNDYAYQFFGNLLNQLEYVNLSLDAALNVDTITKCDQLINDKQTITWLNIKALEEMRKTLASMMDKPPKSSKTKKIAIFSSFVGIALFGTILVSRKLL